MARKTQTEIINALASEIGLKKSDIKGFFDALAALAAGEVKRSGEFVLPGFGRLVKATRKAREGRNPATGGSIKIPAKTVVRFRLKPGMRAALAGDPTKLGDPD